MKALKIGIVGYGGMGEYHERELIKNNPYVTVKGIYDIENSKIEAAKSKGLVGYLSYDELLNDEEIEAVLIATPNDSHKELSIKAINNNKHVICEKPVTINSEDLLEIVEVAKNNNKVFMVHQNRRWDSDYLIIRNLYKNKQIGELFQIESRVHGANGIPGDWRHLKEYGGGMLLDWGVHILDQILFMVDSPIKSVYSDLSYVLGDDVDDGFITYINFENGLKAVFEVGTSNFVKLPRWYVKGLKGSGVIYDWDLSGELVVQKESSEKVELKPIKAGEGFTKTMAPPSEDSTIKLELPKGELEYEPFYTNFFKVVRNGDEPIVKNDEVYKVMKLIEDIFESARIKETIYC
ncbi:Gfo/Idh/MocA family protein [Clostridium sp.]|uniref:Gfo/Idh/MocA family protein n=1 Tax=Clostridium sp. TaxID=1506 RepID=UPI003F2BECB0